jgi:GT2 family glycosyltransferase
MDVSIILVNYNTKDLIQNCIKSIFDVTKEVDFEVIIVDNASTDGSKELFETDSRVIYIYNEDNIGFGRANNIGFKIATGEYILCLNSDTLLIENSVSIMINIMRKRRIDILGVKLVDLYGKMIHSYCPFLPSITWELYYNFRLFGAMVSLYYKLKLCFFSILKVGYITGADLMLSARIIKQYGGFDPDFFMYFEESELQKRYKTNGFHSYYFAGTSIIHLEGKSNAIKESRELMYYKSRSIYYKKVYGELYEKMANMVLIVSLNLRCFFFMLLGKKEMKQYYSSRIRIFYKSQNV